LPPLFFLTAPPTSGIYTLSLHDALPICVIADEIAGLTVFGGDFGEARAVGAFAVANDEDQVGLGREGTYGGLAVRCGVTDVGGGDRKSTRLNSSHVKISYAVFCLKKKRE